MIALAAYTPHKRHDIAAEKTALAKWAWMQRER